MADDAPREARAEVDEELGEADTIFERVVRGDLGPRLPGSTYRVQLNKDFTFEAAAEAAGYLHELGVSDLYASPFFQARPGSMHGYDLVDHNALNPEIGSPEAFDRLTTALARLGMGLVLDVVPNHMGVGSGQNAWWMDVLENGPSSVYAAFFDIDWASLKPDLRDKVLLPILGDHYGRVLEGGELSLAYGPSGFFVRYYATPLPIAPCTYEAILDPMLPGLVEELGEEHDAVLELRSILTALRHLPPRSEARRAKMIERRREKEIQKRRLALLVEGAPAVRAALAARLAAMNGKKGDPRSFDALDALLEAQSYRLGYWRVAAEEINYRRFFDINDLAAIRMENPAVFAEAHRLLFQLLAERKVTGLRIDHPDGLWDPESYLARLGRVVFRDRLERELAAVDDPARRLRLEAALMRRFDRESTEDPEAPPRPLYVVVEKILARGEELPRSFAVFGTSGYEFATLVGGLFVDAAAEREVTAIYERFSGRRTDFLRLMYEKKRLILMSSLASELNVLAHALSRIAARDRMTRDFTLGTLADVLREVIASFPVYRTYVREETVTVAPRDRAAINVAFRLARRRSPTTDASAYAFLRGILMLEAEAQLGPEDRAARRELVMRFQQLTGPVMAKGLEDTAFYVYNRLVSLNEVGGEPEKFGIGVAEFHQGNEDRLRLWPYSMLATSTHDTKRSEDVRARISVISEIPAEWGAALMRWAEANAAHAADLDGQRAPDWNEEYLFYQTVLGTLDPEAGSSAAYVERLVLYMRKATKEAKINTSWVNADAEYDAAVEAFVRRALDPGSPFVEAIRPLARVVAFHGRWGALSQQLLKLTSPGVPDVYQGTELWDDSLVDPDNRRPVDFARRRALLAEIRARAEQGAAASLDLARELVDTAADGRIKLLVTHAALTARRRSPDLFGAAGAYAPLLAAGARRDHVVAFARRAGDREIVTIAPRLTAKLLGGRLAPPIGDVWAGTSVPAREGVYRNLLTGEEIAAELEDGVPSLPLARVLQHFPVALLVR